MDFLKKLEFRIKETFFRLFQLFLKKGKADFRFLDGRKLNRILLLRPDRIGDTVCSFPLIDSLKKSFPQLKISIFASSKNYPLIKNDLRFEKIFVYRRNIINDIDEVIKIRRERYECVVDLLADDSVTTLFLSQLCSVKSPRFGLGKKKFEKFYDFNYTPPEECFDHTVDINLKLMNAFGDTYEIADKHAPPYIDLPEKNRIGEFLEKITSGKSEKVLVGFNLSARGENRNWGYDKSKELISKILPNYGNCIVVLITVPSERSRGDRLLINFNERVTQIPPDANLVEVSALISKLDLLISPDTSLVHIARSFRIPVIGLYAAYKNVYRQWRPFDQEDGLVLSYGGDDVFNITVDEVYDEFSRMIQKYKTIDNKRNKVN